MSIDIIDLCTKAYNFLVVRQLRKKQIDKLPELLSNAYKINLDRQFAKISERVRNNPRQIIPYDFVDYYKSLDLPLSRNAAKKEVFVEIKGQNFFFPYTNNDDFIRESVKIGLAEQDNSSPHRYNHHKETKATGNIAVFAGASNCIYALALIEGFNHIYLFEPDESWHEPMSKTVEPWKSKVTIVKKAIGSKSGNGKVRLDDFFKDIYSRINFIQADIEGAELDMLWGAQKLLHKAQNLKLSIACYHNYYDQQLLGDFLQARGYQVRTSPGYMLMFHHYPLKYPYLRRGVIYAEN